MSQVQGEGSMWQGLLMQKPKNTKWKKITAKPDQKHSPFSCLSLTDIIIKKECLFSHWANRDVKREEAGSPYVLKNFFRTVSSFLLAEHLLVSALKRVYRFLLYCFDWSFPVVEHFCCQQSYMTQKFNLGTVEIDASK